MNRVVKTDVINTNASINKIAGDAQTKPWHVNLKIFISKTYLQSTHIRLIMLPKVVAYTLFIKKVILIIWFTITHIICFATFLSINISHAGVENEMKSFLFHNKYIPSEYAPMTLFCSCGVKF